MKMTRQIAARMAALAVLALPVCATAQPAVDGLAGLEVDELTKCVQAIESAKAPDPAASAYTKGCAINRRSSKLQLAYLRRMLQLGRPDIAQFPAGHLSQTDPKSGLAWGTLAYVQAKKPQYLAALPLAVKAAEFEPHNEPICQNAAQLVAWYEAAKRGNVDAETTRTMKDLPSASKELAAAYKRAKQAFKKLAEIKAEKDKLTTAAEAEAKKAEAEYKKLSDQLKSAGRAYNQTVGQLQDAQQDLARTYANNSNNNNKNNNTGNYNPRPNNQQRDSIQRRINELDRDLRQQETEGKKIRGEVIKARNEAQSKSEHAAKLDRDAKRLAESMPEDFAWLPPAVDGVMTPDATLAKSVSPGGKPADPASSYLVPGRAATQPAKPQQAPLEQRLAEAQAVDKLEMAKLCMASKDDAMKARARELLDEIVNKFASTTSAAEAKQLLAKLQ